MCILLLETLVEGFIGSLDICMCCVCEGVCEGVCCEGEGVCEGVCVVCVLVHRCNT